MNSVGKIAVLIPLFVLSACSSSPSDTDIKNAVIAKMGIENCRNFTVEDFQKINGIMNPNGNAYEAQFKFTLKIPPVKNSKEIVDSLNAKHASEDAKLKEAEAKYNEFKEARKNEASTDFAKNQILDIKFDQEVSSAKSDINMRDSADGIFLVEKLSEGCAQKKSGFSFMSGFLSQMNKDLSWMQNGYSKEITDRLILIKSDNGWIPAN